MEDDVEASEAQEQETGKKRTRENEAGETPSTADNSIVDTTFRVIYEWKGAATSSQNIIDEFKQHTRHSVGITYLSAAWTSWKTQILTIFPKSL